MLHLIVGNKIVNNMYNTLLIIVDCSRGLNRKAKQRSLEPTISNSEHEVHHASSYCGQQDCQQPV
jgi:hypothetical protein